MEFSNRTIAILVAICVILSVMYLGGLEYAYEHIYIHDHFGIFDGPVQQHEH